MNRIKLIALALLATLVLSATAASAAQAGEFHSEIEKTFLFGEQEGENTLRTTAGNIKCKEATFDSLNAQVGTGSGTDWKTKTWIWRPHFGTCTGFGVTTEFDNPPKETGVACNYHLTASLFGANLKKSGTPIPASGTAACEMKFTVTAGSCSVVINNQEPSTPSVTFANVTSGGKPAVKATWAVKGITTNVEGAKGSICGEPEVMNTAEYIGNVVIRGYKSSTHTEANQVGIKYE